MNEPLETEVVYHNLAWSWSWWGLNVFHLLAMLVPTVAYFFVAAWVETLPKSFALPVLVTSVVAVMTLHFRQAPGWIDRWLNNAGLPPLLSHRLQVDQAPFPVSREDLQCFKR